MPAGGCSITFTGLRAGKRRNRYLQRAFDKHRPSALRGIALRGRSKGNANPRRAPPFQLRGACASLPCRARRDQKIRAHRGASLLGRRPGGRPAASLPRLPASPSGPSPEYRHYDIEAPAIDARTFRPVWRRQTRLAALFEAGRISREAFVAATLWRGWAEAVGKIRVQRWSQRIPTAALPAGATSAQITAAKELRAAGAALADYRTRILFEHLVEELCWRELGLKLHMDAKTALQWTVASLESLAAWRQGRPLPPPPRERFRTQPGSW